MAVNSVVGELIKFTIRPGQELQTLQEVHSNAHVVTKRLPALSPRSLQGIMKWEMNHIHQYGDDLKKKNKPSRDFHLNLEKINK